jgi:hypothetical protein
MTDLRYEREGWAGPGTTPSIGWLSLAGLLQLLSERGIPLESGTLIALGVESELAPNFRRAAPAHPDEAWQFLGWDIVGELDTHGALCDYGFEVHGVDMRSQVRHLISDVNEFHLFNGFEAAQEFRRWRESATPQEGPYRVVGVWEIPLAWATGYGVPTA